MAKVMPQIIAIWLQKRPFFFSSLIMAFLFALTLSVLTPTYETNDDVALSMVASGTGICIAPDEHLVFTNVSIGLVLKWLYTQIPDFPWYASYLVATQYLAFTALLFSIIAWRFTWVNFCLFLLVFATVGINSFVYLQFTRVAFFTTEIGIVLALTALYRRAENPQYQPAWMLIVSGCLMVLGSLIRFDSFLGACGVAFPVVAFTVWRLAKEHERRAAIWIPTVVTGAIVVCLAVGAELANARYYAQDAAWQEFLAFNKMRVNFNDIRRTEYLPETLAVFDAAEWSENDHEMIVNWFFDDTRVYSLEKMAGILNGCARFYDASNWDDVPFWFMKIWLDRDLWPMWIVLPIFLWHANCRRAYIRSFVLLTCSIFGMLLVLMLFVKYPDARVYFPMYSFQLIMSLLLVRIGPTVQQSRLADLFTLQRTMIGSAGKPISEVLLQMSGKKLMAACLACALIGLIISEHRCFRRSRKIVKANDELYASLAKLEPRSDKLFVTWGSCFPFEFMLPFDSPAKNRDIQFLEQGWITKSPIHNAMKKRHGIDETVSALINHPNVYLISIPDLNERFTIFVCEHFQTDVQWDNCFKGKSFLVWKPNQTGSLHSTEVRAAMNSQQQNY
jgi:hypothetical protein